MEKESVELLKNLADSLGVATEMVYEAVYRQIFIDLTVYAVVVFAIAILIAIVYRYVCSDSFIEIFSKADQNGCKIVLAFCVFFGIVLPILINGHSLFTALANPHYAVMEEVLNLANTLGNNCK